MASTTEAPNTRARILAAAIELFQARGYHGVGLAEILEIARAPKGSLYHHFPGGKEALALAAIERVAENAFRVRDPTRGASAYYLAMAESIAAWMKLRDYAVSPLILTLAVTSYEPRIQAAAAEAYQRYRTSLEAMLRMEGRADPRALADFAFAALEGGVVLARLERDRAPLLAAVRKAAEVLASAQQA